MLGLLASLAPTAAWWILAVQVGALDFVVPPRLAIDFSGAPVIGLACVLARLRRPVPPSAE